MLLKEQIFEAVESLRQRKCRPDRETIAHFVTRRYSVQFQEVFTELENIVDQGGLLKVEYKGSVSYRSPEQFDTNTSPLLTKHSKILNSSRTSRLVITAVSELLNENPDWDTDGIPQKDLEAKVVIFDAVRFNSSAMQTIMEREIAVGNLVVSKKTGRLFPKDLFPKNETIATGKKPRRNAKDSASTSSTPSSRKKAEAAEFKTDSSDDGRKDVAEKVAAAVRKTYGFAKATPSQAVSSPPGSPETDTSASSPPTNVTNAPGPGRHSARNKRKKEVFDPSDLPPPTKKGLNTCKSCTKLVSKGDEFLACSTCASNYHMACVKDPPKIKSTRRSASVIPAWICPGCKECDVCGGGGNSNIGEEDLLDYICSECDNVVILHKNCIEATDERKCGKCMDGIIEPLIKDLKKKKGRPPKKARVSTRKSAAAKSQKDQEEEEAIKSDSEPEVDTTDSGGKPAVPKNASQNGGHGETSTTHTEDSTNNKAETVDTDKLKVDNVTTEVEAEPIIPDPKEASSWTPKDVEGYFHSKGLKEEGTVFREQEIDGVALLLMRRSDILQGMKFLLGPALKIYRLIVELQKV